MMKRAGMLAVLALVGLAMWTFWPESAWPDVAGLDAAGDDYDVTILRDTWGVPHIFGVTDPDAAYGLAYAHAEDDFLTIQQSLLAARGDLATVYGRDAAPNDYLVDLVRLWETVDREYERSLSPEVRDVVEAYADGLNHYAALHHEDALVGLFPVRGEDIVAASVHKSPLFFGLDGVLGSLFGDERPAELTASAPEIRHGSNVMAVGPARTPNDSTLFLSNSHQPWTGPVAWYEAHVHSEEGWDAVGALFPSMPVIAVGHNRHLAWSFTVNHPDLIDVYLLDVDPSDPGRYRVDGEWLEFETWEVPIEVRLAGRLRWTVRETARWSIYGPVIERPHGTYAIRYAGTGQVGVYEQFFAMNKATTFSEWRAALATQDGLASFNVGYADAEGTVYYLYNAQLPVRDPAYDWSGLLPGDTRRTLWTDYVPFDELPQVLNPPSGFIVNANSSPFAATTGDGNPDPADYPDSLGIEMFDTNRSLRALELLGGDSSITASELRQYKFDARYADVSDMARWRDRLVELAPVGLDDEVALVDGWDLTADRGSRGAALMVLMLTFLTEADVDVEFSRLTDHAIPDAVLVDAFRSAADYLIATYGTADVAWEDVNRIRRGDVDVGVSGGPDTLRAIYGSRDGDGTLSAEGGDAYVLFVTFLADGTIRSESIHQFGSATLDEGSRHYDDQVRMFAAERLRDVWYDEAVIRQHLESEYRPGDEISGGTGR